MKLQHAPSIDFDAHPGFAGLPSRPPDPEEERLIAEIDAAYGDIWTVDRPLAERQQKFDVDVAPRFDALRARVCVRVRSQFARHFGLAMDHARRMLRDDLAARDFSAPTRNDTENLKPPFRDGLSFLRSNGFFKFRNAGLAKRVWATLPLERAMLRLRKKLVNKRHCVMPIHPYSPAGRMIRRTMKKSGMVDFISAYIGKPMEFYYAALDHAHPAQDWYQDCYADVGLPTSKTVYMHTDADFDIIKTMFYLHDVEEKDGPFRFVAGSHRWIRSPLALAVQKGFDQTSREVFSSTPENGDYYRPWFKSVDHRQDIMTLPPQLRGSTHFGDDVMDGSELSEALLEAEESFVSPAGTTVVFDGSRGIHRGGQAKPGGRRWAVQLAFQVRRGAAPTRWEGLRKEVRGTLSYGKYVITRLAALAAGRAMI